jgi:hypothetical protein
MEVPAGGFPGAHRSLIQRMIGAAMLDVSVYEEVEADRSATGQAAIVVAIVAVCAAIGSWGHGNNGIIGAVVGAFLGWLLMSALTYFIGTKLFGGTADMGEMLRTLGFAQSPGVIAVLGLIPILGRVVVFAVAIWQLVTAVVAIRQALDIDTMKAVATGFIAWLVVVVVTMVVMGMLLGTGMALRAATG